MKGLQLAEPGQRLSVLCLGAHSDDIEIGAGATLLQWQASGVRLDVLWCVLSAAGPREAEARESAAEFLAGAERARIETHKFRDGFFPAELSDIKGWFEQLKGRIQPDVILTHHGNDAHQDHRETSRLTWNTFRDHLILEYEIPKYDGDLGAPNVFVPLDQEVVAEKLALLREHFPSQSARHWFDDELFRGLMRLRGMESATSYAEAFTCRKVVLEG